MKTVLEHLVDAGYIPEKALNYLSIGKQGTMECERIQIRKFKCSLSGMDCVNGVEARAIVKYSDGGEYPYPSFGWTKSLESEVTLYFKGEQYFDCLKKVG